MPLRLAELRLAVHRSTHSIVRYAVVAHMYTFQNHRNLVRVIVYVQCSLLAENNMRMFVDNALNHYHVLLTAELVTLLEQLDATGSAAFSITDFYVDHCAALDIRGITFPDMQWADAGRPETLPLADKLARGHYRD